MCTLKVPGDKSVARNCAPRRPPVILKEVQRSGLLDAPFGDGELQHVWLGARRISGPSANEQIVTADEEGQLRGLAGEAPELLQAISIQTEEGYTGFLLFVEPEGSRHQHLALCCELRIETAVWSWEFNGAAFRFYFPRTVHSEHMQQFTVFVGAPHAQQEADAQVVLVVRLQSAQCAPVLVRFALYRWALETRVPLGVGAGQRANREGGRVVVMVASGIRRTRDDDEQRVCQRRVGDVLEVLSIGYPIEQMQIRHVFGAICAELQRPHNAILRVRDEKLVRRFSEYHSHKTYVLIDLVFEGGGRDCL